MNVVSILLTTGVAFILLFLIFRPLESVFPAKAGQPVLREHWFVDLAFFLGQYIVWNAIVLTLTGWFGSGVRELVPSDLRSFVASQSIAIQAVFVVLVSDLLVYWGHRAQHSYRFLWRFHAVHHTAEHLDWLAAHREHPVDSLYTTALVNLPLFLTGIPISTLAYFAAFRGIWAVYIHSNVRLPLGPIRMLIGAPELHHWHHDRDRFAGNYANVSPIMDIIFGTYRCPDYEPSTFGIEEPVQQSYLGLLWYPFHRDPDRSTTRKDRTGSHFKPLVEQNRWTGTENSVNFGLINQGEYNE
jgi:sterol desaturase/sphingolipid hydroxylase (fatty acid hydroxylase superfamily)